MPREYSTKVTMGGSSTPISSFQRLSPDLVEEVFFHCRVQDCRPIPSQAPLSLCHVSSTWRAIAFRRSRLWDTLSLLVPKDLSSNARESLAKITQFWFRNARKMPLVFSLTYEGSVDHDPDGLRSLEDVIISYSDQFRNLAFDIHSQAHILRFFHLPSGSLGRLESLRLGGPVHVFSMGSGHVWPMTAVRAARCLRSLDIVIDEDITSSLSLLPWHQLTYLKIDSCYPHTSWRKLFRQCVLLEHCHLMFNFFHGEELDIASTYPNESIVFPNLIKITVSSATASIIKDWSRDLVFPALSELVIQRSTINSEWTEVAHRRLRLHSLRYLTLDVNGILLGDLLLFLCCTPSLVELELGGAFFDSGMLLWNELSFLKERDLSEQLLTKVEVIRLRFCTAVLTLADIRDISEMIKSRWYTTSADLKRVQTVSLYFGEKHLVDEMNVLLGPLKLEGLQLQVDYVEDSAGVQW